MKLFGFQITKAVPATLSPVSSARGGWWPMVREPWAGAWQRNVEWTLDTVLAHHAVYACVTLISNDVGKLRPKLVEQDADGIWSETKSAAFSPVLRKPNRFQNRIQFIEWWITSKLLRGNTYVLKERDDRGVVVRLYLLDPSRVTVLVAPDGSVFYQLSQDNLSGIESTSVSVPAKEIIHDRINCLFHPLVGVSPIFACGAAANIGLTIQENSTGFFSNGSNPSGILSAVTSITPEKSKELSAIWNEQFSGDRTGGVAVLGDGMKFEPMRMTAVDSQMIEHLKWTAETVCSAFHVPPWKVHVGTQPAYTKPELANQMYYSDCLQSLIEQFELCMDEGLGLDESKDGKMLGVELDLDGLLRMDESSQVETLTAGIGGSLLRVNEARRRFNAKPVPGGDQIWMQQQNYSLEALAARDAAGPPPNSPGDRRAPAPAPAPAPATPAEPPQPPKQVGSDDPAFWHKAAEAYRAASYTSERVA